jgi:iduronate 2-sulfatase
MTGLPAPDGPLTLEGKSLVPVLRDPRASVKDHILHVYPRGERLGRAIRTARYRLVEWKQPGADAETAEFELYDYQNDPGETKNLSREQPETVAKLRALLTPHGEAKRQISANNNKPAPDRAAMFARRDKDGNGKLTREEFLANQPDPDKAPARFVTFDKDQDGVLSKEEFVKAGK